MGGKGESSCVTDSISLAIRGDRRASNALYNSEVNPIGPGDLLFFRSLIIPLISSSVI